MSGMHRSTQAPPRWLWMLVWCLLAVGLAGLLAGQLNGASMVLPWQAMSWPSGPARVATPAPVRETEAPAPAAGPAPSSPPALWLLLPDAVDPRSLDVQAWVYAAAELGYPLETVTATQWLHRPRGSHPAALVLPDAVHQRMSDLMVAHLHERVQAGDRLMLVHDAGMADLDGVPAPERSRLSSLAGVDYGLYRSLGEAMQRAAPVQVLPSQVGALRIPPGKLMQDGRALSGTGGPAQGSGALLAGPRDGVLAYPGYVTRGRPDGLTLLQTPDGSLVAGRHRVGAGEVLFINLPLTRLKLAGDAWPLHGLLQYYAGTMAGLPQLASMPQARGALVMNWHVDRPEALPALARAQALGALAQGPYSMHFAAGPDLVREGDGRGLNLPGSAQAQEWVRRLAGAGHAIGTEGAWLPDRAAASAPGSAQAQVQAQTQALIERQRAMLAGIAGMPVREVSAPAGVQPVGVIEWLGHQGVPAYAAMVDAGMPPTRSFQGALLPPPQVWAFPPSTLGPLASFEAFEAAHLGSATVSDWLLALDRYCATQRTIRMVSVHPAALLKYEQALQAWLVDMAARRARGELRWMTMTEYADFANQRLAARWALAAAPPGASTTWRLRASHPDHLGGLTWLLPRERWAEPLLVQGQARIDVDGPDWRIVAEGGRSLELGLQPLPPTTVAPPAPYLPSPSAAQRSAMARA